MVGNLIKKFMSMFGRTQSGWYPTMSQILQYSDTTVLKPYEQSVWVYACIRAMADNISKVPIILEKTSVRGKKKVITDGPLYDVLQEPNPFQTGREFIDSTVSWWQYRGEAFWVLERESMFDAPSRMWTFDPRLFEAVISESGTELLGYKIRLSKNKIIFVSRENIVHFKDFNPNSIVRGFSKTNPAKMGIDQTFNAAQYNNAFFKNGAIVSGLLITKEEMSEESYNRLLETWEDRHKGAINAHKIGLLEGGVDFKMMNFSHKDMDFPNLMKTTKQEILVSYGVSEVILGEYVNIKSYEGINAVQRGFWHENLIPKIRYMESVIDIRLLRSIDSSIKLLWNLAQVEALKEDYMRKIDQAYGLLNLGFTPNQINERLDLGMQPVDWGDYALIQNSRIPVGSKEDLVNLLNQGSSAEEEEEVPEDSDDDGEEDTPEEDQEDIFKKFEDHVSSFRNLAEDAILVSELKVKDDLTAWERIAKVQEELELRFRKKFKRYFMDQRVRLLKAVPDPNVKNFDSKLEIKELFDILKPLYEEGIQAGVSLILEELDVGDETASNHTELLKSHLKNACVEIVNSLEKGFRELETNFADPSTLNSEVKKRYNKLGNYQAKKLAKIESTTVLIESRIAEMKFWGIEEHKWLSGPDGDSSLNGQVSKIGLPFKTKEGKTSNFVKPGYTREYEDFAISFTVPEVGE